MKRISCCVFSLVFMTSILLLVIPSLCVFSQTFNEEMNLFFSEQTIEFSRNTKGSIAVDSSGRVHIVYDLLDGSTNPPHNQILYQVIENDQISLPIRVDNGSIGGGKQPSLAIDSYNTVHVVWHDYRHTTAAGNYIDNVEIYYDKKSETSTFSETDVRLSNTNAGHQGDNGYVPNITIGNDNTLHVVWYDFTGNGNNADIYRMSSDRDGNFPLQQGIEPFRITSIDQDSGDQNSNWVPDAAWLPDNSIYVVWGFLNGWQGLFELKGKTVGSETISPSETIALQGGRYNDPARLVADTEGNLGLVYPEYVDGLYRINLHYKPFGENWQGPLVLNDGLLSSTQPCAAFTSTNELLVVWQEDIGGYYQIVLAQIDSTTLQVINRRIISNTNNDARTPAISYHAAPDMLAVAWIDYDLDGNQSIILCKTASTGIQNWRHY